MFAFYRDGSQVPKKDIPGLQSKKKKIPVPRDHVTQIHPPLKHAQQRAPGEVLRCSVTNSIL